MKIKLNKILLLAVTIIGIASCKKVVFEDTYPIESNAWHKSKPAIFDFTIKDVAHPYNVTVSVSNTDDYRYSNLYLFVDIFMPNKKVVRDTVDCIVANEKGEWTGSGWFAPYKNEYPFKKSVLFPVSGKYRIVIEQAMRCDNGILDDIAEVGIAIEQQ